MQAVVIKVVSKGEKDNVFDKLTDTIVPADPDIIPQISPITSLQKEDTLSDFLISFTAVFAPFTFLELIELKGSISALVTATPIISNKTPRKMNKKISKISTTISTFGRAISHRKEKTMDKVKARSVIFKIQFISTIFLFLH